VIDGTAKVAGDAFQTILDRVTWFRYYFSEGCPYFASILAFAMASVNKSSQTASEESASFWSASHTS
jgi:hypothetical protein